MARLEGVETPQHVQHRFLHEIPGIERPARRGGQRGTFRYDYTSDIADGTYDVVVNLQAIQHADDWRETGADMLRVMKRGRNIVLAEIAYSPETRMKIAEPSAS